MTSLAATTESSPQVVDEQVCFAVYSTMLGVQRTYRRVLKQFDLTYPRYLVMLVLWERDELTVSEIGMRLFLDSSTTTPLLKHLESSGLVSRRRSIADERLVIVTLTEAGRALQSVCSFVPTSVAHAMQLTERQAITLRSDLNDLRSNLLRTELEQLA